MGLKEEKKLTQTTIDGVISGVTALCQGQMQLMYQKICGILPSLPEELEAIFDVNGVFGRPFYGLETRYMEEEYYTSVQDL